jgi:predicted GTPase
MNDKIKQLLENAEQSDAIAINKWRIENREQLRKERKEKLKELMEKDKQLTEATNENLYNNSGN